MRWSIIRLIWLRELRDQFRDRRTLFMIAVLPLLLYPVLGLAVVQFQFAVASNICTVGIVRGPGQSDTFPEPPRPGTALSPGATVAWLSLTPIPGGVGVDRWAGAAALASAGRRVPDYVPLLEHGRFATSSAKAASDDIRTAYTGLRTVFLPGTDDTPLKDGKVDVILSAPLDFYVLLEKGENPSDAEQPALKIDWRKNDAASRQAIQRLVPILQAWKEELKRIRLARKGLRNDFDEPFEIKVPGFKSGAGDRPFDLLVRIFPFMLVMWSLAGALYPAVDLCAGEKERGTMETLLISPAGREEIVLGKFLTIWVFSAATAFLNLVSMGLTTWVFTSQLPANSQFPHGGLSVAALSWCLVLLLPTSAFFSAISLAVGAYARSSKEGQYYLMPLFLITMPLMFLTLAPGVKLSPFYSLIPITGVALLMQELMTGPGLDEVWFYFVPVLAPIALYSWLALRWAIEQFKREEVLFREAERLDIGLWLRRLFREKEALPTTGQAVFCFGLIIGLRWVSLSLGARLPALVHAGVSLMAFVATPALMIAIILNTRPREGLLLQWPDWRDVGVAALLSILLLPPLAAFAVFVFNEYPPLRALLEDRQPVLAELMRPEDGRPSLAAYLLAFGLLPAVCEEIAFRGFILTGLQRRFRPRNAVILCSFLFALFHMNVFQFLPAFFLGVVLGLLTIRSQSLLPAMMFHLLHNGMLVLGLKTDIVGKLNNRLPGVADYVWTVVTGLCLTAGLGLLWWLYREPYVALARRQERTQV
jgi:sodium transport system permease protein